MSIDSNLVEFNIYQEMYHILQLALQESTQFFEDCNREKLLSQAIHDDVGGIDDTNNKPTKPTLNASTIESPSRLTFCEQQTFDDLRNGSFEYILVEGVLR